MNRSLFQFVPGDHVYVRGWSQDQTVIVTMTLQHCGFPHYLVVDDDGDEWQIAQIELSWKPIPSEE